MSPAEAVAKHRTLVALWLSAGPDAAAASIANLPREDLEYLLALHTGSAAQTSAAVR